MVLCEMVLTLTGDIVGVGMSRVTCKQGFLSGTMFPYASLATDPWRFISEVWDR